MTPKPNLDFMRAFAVLLVVVEHMMLALRVTTLGRWQTAWVGVVGVFMIFVHTSLVLMWSLERRPFMLDFYIRRIFRIYPLAILAVLLAVALRAPVNGDPMHYFRFLPVTPKNIVIVCLLLQNLSYAPSRILSVMWSLPLEVQMYVFLPYLFFTLRRERALWPIFGVWLFSVALCRILFLPEDVNFLTVVPDFLPGIMAYVLFDRIRARLPSWLLPLFLLSLLVGFMHNPGPRVAWILCLVLGLGLPHFQQFHSAWIVRPSHELAKYSYGIYLAHPFSIVLGLYVLRAHSLPLQITVAVVSLAIFAVAAYHLIEYPLIRIGSRVATRVEKRHEQKQIESVM